MIVALLALLHPAAAEDNVLLKQFGMDVPSGMAEVPGRRLDGHLILNQGGEEDPARVPWLHAGYGRLDPSWELPGRQRVAPPRCADFRVVERQSITIDGLPAQLTVAEAVLTADGTPVVVYDAVAYDRRKQPLFVVEAVVPARERGFWLAEIAESVDSVDLAVTAGAQ